MSLKKGVRSFDCLSAEILLALMIAKDVYVKFGYDMVVTSLADGKHGKNSLHYTGHAADLRTRHMRVDDKEVVADEIRKNAGDDYDIVVEKTHIHMEYDPD